MFYTFSICGGCIHASMMLESTLCQISVERSGLQFTPGGHSLVSLDSIKMPYCRFWTCMRSNHSIFIFFGENEVIKVLRILASQFFSARVKYLACARRVPREALMGIQ